MIDTQMHTERNAKTVVTIVTVENVPPVAGILSRFVPSADTLTPAERRRLMETCAAECRSQFTAQAIDWQAVDEINVSIATATKRSELIPLLTRYKSAVIGGKPA